MNIKWIKITTDIFDDEKILLIESLPEADSIIVIWFKLLTFAGKQNNSGVFMMSNRIAYTDEMLATIFRRPISTVRLALQTFEQFGMIEIIDSVITIPNWDKHQSLDRYEQAKEQTRIRVAKHREKQKLLAENDVTLHVTQCNADRIDIDKDKEEDKDINQSNKSPLDDALIEFEKMRKAIKKPLTPRAKELILKNLQVLASTEEEQVEILNQSIENSWQGVYPLKKNKKEREELAF